MKKILSLLALTVLLSSCAGPIAKYQKAYDNKEWDKLAIIVQKSNDPWLVEDAAFWLGYHNKKEYLDILKERMTDQSLHERARVEIVVAVAKLGDKSIVGDLISALETYSTVDERCRLLKALTYHCTEESVAALEQATHDNQPLVSRIAAKSLQDCQKK